MHMCACQYVCAYKCLGTCSCICAYLSCAYMYPHMHVYMWPTCTTYKLTLENS